MTTRVRKINRTKAALEGAKNNRHHKLVVEPRRFITPTDVKKPSQIPDNV